MKKITESDIELFAIEQLEKLGFNYIYGPTVAPDASINSATGESSERSTFEEVLLIERLRNAVSRINSNVPEEAREDAIKQIQRISAKFL